MSIDSKVRCHIISSKVMFTITLVTQIEGGLKKKGEVSVHNISIEEGCALIEGSLEPASKSTNQKEANCVNNRKTVFRNN